MQIETPACSFSRGKTYPLNKNLIRLSRYRREFFTTSAACENVSVPGAIGSCKTTTTLRIWAEAYFEAGFGGLCMGLKADFAETMEHICAKASALNRTIFLREGQNGINLIGAESRAFGEGNGLAENLTDLLFKGTEVITRQQGFSSDPFWEKAARLLCNHLVTIDMKDTGSLDVRRLLRLLQSIPRRYEDLEDESRECLAAINRVRKKIAPGESYEFDAAAEYVLKTCPGLGERTLSSISISLEVIVSAYCRETVYQAICRDSDSWELSEIRSKGLIVVVDFPGKGGYLVTGSIIGAAVKAAVQRQIERELKDYPQARRNRMRPIAFILDDCGAYLNSEDAHFLSTGRESRACVVAAWHSLGLLRDQFGGTDAALNKAKTCMSFFRTVVGHESDDEETCRYYSGKRGERLALRVSGGTGSTTQVRDPSSIDKKRGNDPGDTGGESENRNYAFVPAPDLPYWIYGGLKRGTVDNAGEVGVIMTMPKVFKASMGGNRRWLKLRLYQEPPANFAPASTFSEWVNQRRFRWNHIKGRNCFIWFDSTPRVRTWTGWVPFWKVCGWMLINPVRGFRMLRRWFSFWFGTRETAVRLEVEDGQ